MTTIQIEIIKKNSPKNNELLDFLYEKIDSINQRGYIVHFVYAKGKGKYPLIRINGNNGIVEESGLSQIKKIINQITTSNNEEGFTFGQPSAGGADIRDQMMNIMGDAEDDKGDDEADDILTNDKIRARSEAINAMRGDRWDSKNAINVNENTQKKKPKNNKPSQASSNNKRVLNTKNMTPNDDTFGQLLMGKIGE